MAIKSKILEGFEGQPFRVISPVKALVEKLNVKVPSNVIATGWLPAHKVNPMADITVIHGGIGTVMTACLAGLPVVGVGMQPEQEANLECLVRKGFAIRIKKRRLSSEKINEDIKKLLKANAPFDVNHVGNVHRKRIAQDTDKKHRIHKITGPVPPENFTPNA